MTPHPQNTHNDQIHGHEIIKNIGTYKVNIPTTSTSRDSITIFIELPLSEKYLRKASSMVEQGLYAIEHKFDSDDPERLRCTILKHLNVFK